MRVGIDIKCLRYNNSGIGRYLRSMLDALQSLDHDNEYILFSPDEISYGISNPNFKKQVVPAKKFLGKKLPGILWQQTALPKYLRENPVDIFWGPEQTLPNAECGCKKILTVHDFVHKRYPETMRKSVLWINNHIGGKSIRVADKIISVSDFTQTELKHFYPTIPDAKLDVVPCGTDCGAPTSLDNLEHSHRQSNKPLERKKQLLFVGSLEPRKNFKNLVKALEILQERGIEIPLIMTGPQGWKNADEVELLKNSAVAKKIQHLGFVNEEQLRQLYAESSAIVFPSFYEGFGLPVIEALSNGTPVLTSQGTVMESIAKDCGIYFDPCDAKSIADVIEKYFATPEPWNFLKLKNAAVNEILGTYRWENSAKKLLEIFNELGQRKEATR